MNYSDHTVLYQPLVGTEAQHTTTLPSCDRIEKDHDESKSIATQQQSQSQQQQQPVHSHDTWMSIVLFLLMFLQFGILFHDDKDHVIQGISYKTINLSIGLFILATYLYRHALYDCQVQNDVIMLVPEILIIFAMILGFFHYILLAFLTLAIGKLYMACTVIIINSYHLWFLTDDDDDDTTINDDVVGVDKDGALLFKDLDSMV
jgi:hypothetical protein